MKFGKSLCKVVTMSDPEWAPYFMNYKFLKKRIKDIKAATVDSSLEKAAEASEERGAACGESQQHEIARHAAEKEFFRALHFEVKKASDFFVSALQEMEIRFARVQEGQRQLDERITVTDGNFGQMILRACVNLYKDLVMLENFAVMTNYGSTKILKKHDKNSGFVTREKFMSNILRKQPFTTCQRLTILIKDLEALFSSVSSMCASSQYPKLTLQNEQRLFLEVVMDLKSAATNICAEEEIGGSSDSGDGQDLDGEGVAEETGGEEERGENHRGIKRSGSAETGETHFSAEKKPRQEAFGELQGLKTDRPDVLA